MKVTAASLLMNIETGEYPLTLQQARQHCQDASFAAEPEEEALAELGFAVVYPTERPTPAVDQIVEQLAPVLSGGRYEQRWQLRYYTNEELTQVLAQRKLELLADVERLRTQTLLVGGQYTFPDGPTQHIQLRDGDRANLSGLANKAERLIAKGSTETMMFRTYENESRILTPAQMVDMTDASFDLYMLIMSQAWTLQGLINAATTLQDLPVVPAELITALPN